MVLPRVRFTIGWMMAGVAVAALTCYILAPALLRPIGYITQCYGGRYVPIAFIMAFP
jgi:hypothetical protein